MAKRYLDRPPRIQPELPSGTVEIPEPPREENAQPLWQVAVPVVTILAYVLLSATGSGTNITFLLPMALTVFISTGITVFNAINIYQRRRQARADYQRKLVELRRDMVASHQQQRAYYEYNYPPVEMMLEIKGERDNRGGSRLWERRPSDQDFGHLRLGIGTRESTVKYAFSQRSTEGGSTIQNRDAERLQSDSLYLENAPITLPLFQQAQQQGQAKPTPARTIIGISGSPKDVYDFVYALTAHFAVFHAPNDAILNILGLRDAASRWAWAAALPHTAADPVRGRANRLYFEDMELLIAPEAGRIKNILDAKTYVDGKKPVKLNEVVAVIETPQGVRDVRANFPGRLQWVLEVDPQKPFVQKGQIIARMQSFKLTDQQFEEIKQPGYNHFDKRGIDQKKRELAGVPRYWKEIVWGELDGRARRARERGEGGINEVMLPFMLTIVDLLSARPESPDDPLVKSWLYELESEQALSMQVNQGRELGAAILFLVPSRSKIPSACQAIIELKRDQTGALRFLYAETGESATAARIVGDADRAPDETALAQLAAALDNWQVRRSYGADIPRSVALLRMYDADNISSLNIDSKWRDSRDRDKADWPKVPLGMLPGSEPRELHFFADADGVHGMIAGATGSGKSELLMTLILSLAIKYDPSVVNFVLIDYKGGAAFEPFRTLPHVVDVVTNLRGNAVARMFAAIQAELNRRQTINQDTDMKDIVRYRAKGLHLTRQDNYPHLFIIIDEFAEMIANNAEYKAQLDSITRLGRALGVSLILAAQRPTGVTDQMRANIKMKLCLRVETKEESSEMLRLPDASYLPSIPGRGYLQIGNESLQLIQVGYTGQSYTTNDDSGYEPTERYIDSRVIWDRALDDQEPEKLYEVLVRKMRIMVDAQYPPSKPRLWRRPWPRPLPERIALNKPDGIEVEYLNADERAEIGGDLDEPFTLCPAINDWMSSVTGTQRRRRTNWDSVDWYNRALRAPIGLIDDPSRAKLRILEINLRKGHHVLFGTSGYGKSVFLRSLITSLTVTHPPSALHIYILDLGSRSLEIFAPKTSEKSGDKKTGLPHVGAYIISHEAERIARLLRKLDQIIEERKIKLNDAKTDSLLEYNARQISERRPENIMPAILVVIDNFAEFKESYEQHLDTLTALLREGLSTGVYFVITGEQTNAVSAKLFNLIPERLTLRLSDDAEYATIVGRGARMTEEIPGRGLRRVERAPLEMQIAVPIGLTEDDTEDPADEQERSTLERFKLERLIERLSDAREPYSDRLPTPIIELSNRIGLNEVMAEHQHEDGQPIEIVLGRDDFDLKVRAVTLQNRAHFVISGSPASGKTTALQTMILSLAEDIPPRRAGIVLIDYQNALAGDSSSTHTLADLPHVLDKKVLSTDKDLVELERHLRYEFSRRDNEREIFVFIDNYDDMEKLAKNTPNVLVGLSELARLYGKAGLHFIISASKTSMAKDDLIRQVGLLKYGLALDVESAESAPFHGSVPRSYRLSVLPRGRGFVVQPGEMRVVQVAVPSLNEANKAAELDARIDGILSMYGAARADWLPLPADMPVSPTETTNGAGGLQPLTPEQRDCLIEKIIEVLDRHKLRDRSQLRAEWQTKSDMELFQVADTRKINVADCVPGFEAAPSSSKATP